LEGPEGRLINGIEKNENKPVKGMGEIELINRSVFLKV